MLSAAYQKGLPEPSRFTRELAYLKSETQRYYALNSVLQSIDDQFVERHLKSYPVLDFNDLEARHFTDLKTFYEKKYHGLIHGKTNSGKTTLMLSILKRFLDAGDTVLLRDDGGLEFRYLACKYPGETRVFYPNKEGCRLSLQGFNVGDMYAFDDAGQVLDAVGDGDYPFNVVVYDVFCLEPSPAANFYCDLFKQLIYKCMQRQIKFRKKLVFAILELNDIVQPKGGGLTEHHEKVRAMVEYNIRKLRKFNVQMLAETHRFNMISINVRSQFDYVFVKKSYGYDVWDFFVKNLIKASKYTFWAMMAKATTMPQWDFIMFDNENNYDMYRFGDIPRPQEVKCEASGVIKWDGDKSMYQKLYEKREWENVQLMAMLKERGVSQDTIAARLKRSRAAIFESQRRFVHRIHQVEGD